jgi:mono/diheme cytochrome c family protein
MLSRKIACPSCDARLKIAETLAEDTMITCPKCHIGFPVPSANGHSADEAETEPRRLPADDEDGDEVGRERRVARKKFRKKKKAASKAPLIIGLIVGGILVLGAGGAAAAIFLWPKKTQAVAENSPPKSAINTQMPNQAQQGAGVNSQPSGPGAGAAPQGPGVGAFTPDLSGNAGASPPNTGAGVPPERGGGQADEFAAGKRVYNQNCTHCHTIGGDTASGGRGGNRKRDLAGVGGEHDADWFVRFVRDPRRTKPGTRMQGFGDRIGETDLRALGQFLASLK